jgi:hypothetical protein
MAEYLLIESRDPFESNDVGYYYDLARGLVEAGNQVTLFLIKCGVRGAAVKILADDFALKERGITKLLDGIQIAPIEIMVDHLEAGHKTLWRLSRPAPEAAGPALSTALPPPLSPSR